MRWTEYAMALLLFSLVSLLVLYFMQRLQGLLPFNPQGFGAVAPDLAFNTAVSFTTNTNWQAYSGESTMSYFTQMAGLAYHNFVSAAVGIVRGHRVHPRHRAAGEGDARQFLGGHGSRDALGAAADRHRRFAVPRLARRRAEPQALRHRADRRGREEQTIAQGPVASQEIIKQFGTNGGGFFNANSAHPFENPTPLSNFLAMFAIFVISSGFTYTLGIDDRIARAWMGGVGSDGRSSSSPA